MFKVSLFKLFCYSPLGFINFQNIIFHSKHINLWCIEIIKKWDNESANFLLNNTNSLQTFHPTVFYFHWSFRRSLFFSFIEVSLFIVQLYSVWKGCFRNFQFIVQWPSKFLLTSIQLQLLFMVHNINSLSLFVTLENCLSRGNRILFNVLCLFSMGIMFLLSSSLPRCNICFPYNITGIH